jgi:peptide/nickel transport system ATP-binding protein/oligopeptide transport system ATP-binding protein
MSLAALQDVSVFYGHRAALSAIDFAVGAAETVAVIGESGCGKSTLGRAMLGLQRVDKGRVIFKGEDLQALSSATLRRRRRMMQMMFQDPQASLNPRMRVGETLAEPLVVHRMATWRTARPMVADMLERVGLSAAHAARYPHEFSGGQRQRIAIARAMIAGPSLVVADEPLSALDVTLQGQILDLLHRLQQERGLTYVFISHDLPVVRRVASRVYVMLGGRIVEQGPPSEIFATPAHPYTAALLDAVPVADPVIARAWLEQDRPDTPEGQPSPASCPFSLRCPHARPICGEMMPSLRTIAAGRQAACWLHEEAATSESAS